MGHGMHDEKGFPYQQAFGKALGEGRALWWEVSLYSMILCAPNPNMGDFKKFTEKEIKRYTYDDEKKL